MGPSGSGKSVLAGALAARLGAALLSTDALRRALFQRRGARASLDAGIYTTAARKLVYQELERQAAASLGDGRAVVVDGTFVERSQRKPFVDLARAGDRKLLIVECCASDAAVRKRQRLRTKERWSTSEGRWDVTVAHKARYEAPDEVEREERLRLDTERPLAKQLELIETRRPVRR
jgi:predicted kinase